MKDWTPKGILGSREKADLVAAIEEAKAQRLAERSAECVGHDRGGTGRCCDRAGEYNGFGSDGPLLFVCPRNCSCHD